MEVRASGSRTDMVPEPNLPFPFFLFNLYSFMKLSGGTRGLTFRELDLTIQGKNKQFCG